MTLRRGTFRAVLFDLDGTLYAQAPVRLAMATELAANRLLPWRSRSTARAMRVIRAYRRAHEAIRGRTVGGSVASAQVQLAAERSGVPAAEVEQIVSEWMTRRPLKYLRAARRPGLIGALSALVDAGLRVGVLSDYPPAAKLAALGVESWFSLTLCTTDAEINALKPHPRGFEVACGRWRLNPAEVLYVGDRPDVDGAGAMAAGLGFACIGSRRSAGAGWYHLKHFGDLHVLSAS